jgi:hypothetical protein
VLDDIVYHGQERMEGGVWCTRGEKEMGGGGGVRYGVECVARGGGGPTADRAHNRWRWPVCGIMGDACAVRQGRRPARWAADGLSWAGWPRHSPRRNIISIFYFISKETKVVLIQK